MISLAKNSKQKYTIRSRQKRILRLLFLVVETVIEIGKNPISKDNLLPASGK